jgi:ATP-binding cassette subfamily C protein CydC
MSGLIPPEIADCAKPWRPTRRLAIGAAIIVALSTVGLLATSGWFITAAAIMGSAGPATARAFNYLVPSAVIRLLAILRTIGRYFERLLSHRAALSSLASVRTLMFRKAASAEAAGTLRLSGGEAAALLGNDVDALEDRFIRDPAIAGAVAGSVTAVGLSSLAGLGAAMGTATCLGLAALATKVLARRRLPGPAREAAAALAALKADLTENAAAAGEIAVWDLTDRVSAQLEKRATASDEAQRVLARREAQVAIILPAAAGIASAGAIATASGGPALAAMAALAAAAAGEALVGISRAQIRAPAVDAALDRLRALSSTPDLGVAAPIDSPTLLIGTGAQVHEFAPGDRLAIIGRSGTGKTRLLETLAGLRNDAPQRLLVSGEPATSLGLARLRQTFALVPQNAMLIAGTILDNLRLARPGITEAALWDALETACLAQEVRRLPAGLHQWVGEGGSQLSGGQRKRLALARGLLAGRPWLLLDEPSEGLDARTETELAASLELWLKRTQSGLVLVSHRPALLRLCQRNVELS